MEEIHYDLETLRCLAGFDQVWARVSGGSAPRQRETDLEALIRDTMCAHRLYGALARLMTGSRRNAMQTLAAETSRHCRRLQAEFFMGNGTKWTETRCCVIPKGKLDLLHRALTLEEDLAAAFSQAAEACRCEEQQALYRAFCAAANARRQTVRTILIACF